MSRFQKATRKRVYLKLAITGPSGSGKTYGGLMLARGLVGPEGRIAVIDTENDSASLYAHVTDFDTLCIEAPFTTEKYVEAIREAVQEGYDALVIDSLSHAWAAEGGLLSQKEALDARGGNGYTNWAGVTKKHEAFKSALLQSPVHLIATMRSKQEYVVETTQGGKTAPRKVGLAPVQRDGMEYEFSIVFDVAMSHEAIVSKDRTGLFDGVVGVLKAEHGAKIREWLQSGAEVAPPTAPAQTRQHPPAAHHGANGTAPGGMRAAQQQAAQDRDAERERLAEVKRLFNQFTGAADKNGIGELVRDAQGQVSPGATKVLLAHILDVEPWGKDESPTAADLQAGLDGIAAYATDYRRQKQAQTVPPSTRGSIRRNTPEPKDAPAPAHQNRIPPADPFGDDDDLDDPFGPDEDETAPANATNAVAAGL